ncbi:MAG: hypothetical protein KKE43_07560 [Actinobacteria bacterium]|nr:hypothetical protein [Actinomycetota bacterium]
MRVLCGISAALLFLSMCALESAGTWWLVSLAVAGCSLAVMYGASRRLGYVQRSPRSMNSTDQSSRSR